MENYTHPTAIIDEGAKIGKGVKIWANSHICRGAQIGDGCTIGEGVYIGPNVSIGCNCKIQNHALIYEGVKIEHSVFIGPRVTFSNDAWPRVQGEWTITTTLVKYGASICAGATIVCGVLIGRCAMIGAGATVTKDIKDGWLAYGTPAKHIRELRVDEL